VYPHAGGWLEGGVQEAAETFALPLRGSGARAHAGDLPRVGGALSIEPAVVQLSSLAAIGGRVECRVYNPSNVPVSATIRVGAPLNIGSPARIDLFGNELEPLDVRGGAITIALRPREIATVRIS
jgi:mannosylglycerate hydrolase